MNIFIYLIITIYLISICHSEQSDDNPNNSTGNALYLQVIQREQQSHLLAPPIHNKSDSSSRKQTTYSADVCIENCIIAFDLSISSCSSSYYDCISQQKGTTHPEQDLKECKTRREECNAIASATLGTCQSDCAVPEPQCECTDGCILDLERCLHAVDIGMEKCEINCQDDKDCLVWCKTVRNSDLSLCEGAFDACFVSCCTVDVGACRDECALVQEDCLDNCQADYIRCIHAADQREQNQQPLFSSAIFSSPPSYLEALFSASTSLLKTESSDSASFSEIAHNHPTPPKKLLLKNTTATYLSPLLESVDLPASSNPRPTRKSSTHIFSSPIFTQTIIDRIYPTPVYSQVQNPHSSQSLPEVPTQDNNINPPSDDHLSNDRNRCLVLLRLCNEDCRTASEMCQAECDATNDKKCADQCEHVLHACNNACEDNYGQCMTVCYNNIETKYNNQNRQQTQGQTKMRRNSGAAGQISSTPTFLPPSYFSQTTQNAGSTSPSVTELKGNTYRQEIMECEITCRNSRRECLFNCDASYETCIGTCPSLTEGFAVSLALSTGDCLKQCERNFDVCVGGSSCTLAEEVTCYRERRRCRSQCEEERRLAEIKRNEEERHGRRATDAERAACCSSCTERRSICLTDCDANNAICVQACQGDATCIRKCDNTERSCREECQRIWREETIQCPGRCRRPSTEPIVPEPIPEPIPDPRPIDEPILPEANRVSVNSQTPQRYLQNRLQNSKQSQSSTTGFSNLQAASSQSYPPNSRSSFMQRSQMMRAVPQGYYPPPPSQHPVSRTHYNQPLYQPFQYPQQNPAYFAQQPQHSAPFSWYAQRFPQGQYYPPSSPQWGYQQPPTSPIRRRKIPPLH